MSLKNLSATIKIPKLFKNKLNNKRLKKFIKDLKNLLILMKTLQ